jgi:hypothetical protein
LRPALASFCFRCGDLRGRVIVRGRDNGGIFLGVNMDAAREEIINKIKETIRPQVLTAFNNQAGRIIDLQARYYEYTKRHAALHNDYKIPWEEKKAKLFEMEQKENPLKANGVLRYEYMMVINDDEATIKAKYTKKAEKFLQDVGKYVEAKLKGVEINSIENLYFGFNNGAWKINGEKCFRFETIHAGGYNIQCLHIRVIYYYGDKFK